VVVDFDREEVVRRVGEGRSASDVLVSLQDFGGQPVFNPLHHLFIKREAVFLIVFDMRWLAAPPDSRVFAEAREYLLFWMDAIAVHTMHPELKTTAQVAFVGTHKDLVPGKADHDRISSIVYQMVFHGAVQVSPIYDEIASSESGATTKQYFFPVDNTIGTRDPSLCRLLGILDRHMRRSGDVLQLRPVSWIKFSDVMKGLGRASISYREAMQTALSLGVTGRSFDKMLSFLHSAGELMWFHDANLRDTVILEPFSFFVKVVTTVICKFAPTEEDPTSHMTDLHIRCKQALNHHWRQVSKHHRTHTALHRILTYIM
jgi:hypothetical protein